MLTFIFYILDQEPAPSQEKKSSNPAVEPKKSADSKKNSKTNDEE